MRRKRSTQGSDTFTDQRIRVAGDEEGIRQAHFPVKDLGNFGENGQPQGRFDLLARVERPVQQSENDYESEPTHHSKHSGCSNRDLLLRRDRLRRDEGLSELPDHRFIDALGHVDVVRAIEKTLVGGIGRINSPLERAEFLSNPIHFDQLSLLLFDRVLELRLVVHGPVV